MERDVRVTVGDYRKAEVADVQGFSKWGRRIRTADLLGCDPRRRPHASFSQYDLFPGVFPFIRRSFARRFSVGYAGICGDGIRVGNFWREVPEIVEVGSRWPISFSTPAENGPPAAVTLSMPRLKVDSLPGSGR